MHQQDQHLEDTDRTFSPCCPWTWLQQCGGLLLRALGCAAAALGWWKPQGSRVRYTQEWSLLLHQQLKNKVVKCGMEVHTMLLVHGPWQGKEVSHSLQGLWQVTWVLPSKMKIRDGFVLLDEQMNCLMQSIFPRENMMLLPTESVAGVVDLALEAQYSLLPPLHLLPRKGLKPCTARHSRDTCCCILARTLWAVSQHHVQLCISPTICIYLKFLILRLLPLLF